jgi:hypothetical protein
MSSILEMFAVLMAAAVTVKLCGNSLCTSLHKLIDKGSLLRAIIDPF